MEEIWKDIEGYEGYYQVSNLGNVRSLDRIIKKGSHYYSCKGRTLIPFLRHDGYLEVKIQKKHFVIHRLVAKAFIPNPDNMPCINHKDENKTNNNVDNLEWCTYQYNIMYGTSRQRRKDKYKKYGIGKLAAQKALITRAKNNSYGCPKPVNQFSLDGSFIARYDSASEAARVTNTTDSGIIKCCNGKAHFCKGFVWVYDDDLERGKRGSFASNYRGKRVSQFDLNSNFIKTWLTATEAAKSIGCRSNGICACATGKLKTYKGYIWKYS